jgi:endoglucanase
MGGQLTPRIRMTIVCALVAAAATPAATARAGTANGGLPHAARHNPLRGMTWGIYRGPIDSVYPAYMRSRGRHRRLMAKIALRPLTIWAGGWFPDGYAQTVARQIIRDTTQGNPAVLSQIAVFRLEPWEGQACTGTWGRRDQGSFRAWVNGFARGIGTSRVALILQPDLPFAACAHSGTPTSLVAYAARRFNALRHTTVYIDAGAAAWLSPGAMAAILERSGIRHARGFALNVTQYGSTALELEYGAQIVHALQAAGVAGKHFVVNTDENGSPFLAGQVRGNSNETPACRHRGQRLCVTLGIPPTTHVADRRWHLRAADRAIAARYADAYLWAGRPWVDNATGAFVYSRALRLAASTPF